MPRRPSASPPRGCEGKSHADLDELVAIDVHTHAEVSAQGGTSLSAELDSAAGSYFKPEHCHPTLPEIAAHYRERKMACVVFTVDAESATGTPPVPDEEIAEAAAQNPDVIIPFAGVDPHKGGAAVRQIHRMVEEFGVRGFKSHPSIQAFHPDDRLAYPLYEAIEAARGARRGRDDRPAGAGASQGPEDESARLGAENARPVKAEKECRPEREILRRAGAHPCREIRLLPVDRIGAAHRRQTKNLPVSYSPKHSGFFQTPENGT
ncbi:amidohydrolase family protein [Streptomyces sp. NPDC127117]|uniref:amidohydrolase family protein n=1 Tax=Streptomyces sp. NPDC127117 TaxID=3345368 RepID=UPI003645EAA2